MPQGAQFLYQPSAGALNNVIPVSKLVIFPQSPFIKRAHALKITSLKDRILSRGDGLGYMWIPAFMKSGIRFAVWQIGMSICAVMCSSSFRLPYLS